MVSFRPHIIRRVNDDFGSYTDNGDFVKTAPVADVECVCRYEPSGAASTIVLDDGKAYAYSYTVYLCTDCPEFSYGDTVELINQRGVSIGRFSVKGFHRGQLDAKLWV